MSLHSETETAAPGRRIAALFDEHAGMVLAVCRMHLHDPHDAEDAAQQTFLSAYRSLLGGTHAENAAAWLATIARNECRARISRRLCRPATVPLLEEARERSAADVEADVERRAEVDALTRALADLPERQREAVVLRELYGLSYEEIAAAMTISAPAVESLLSRGRRALEKRVARVRAIPAVLVVPASLRDELARLIPGFPLAEGGAVAAVGGGAALLAKLGSTPLAAKAAAVAAVATLAVGTPVVVDRLPGGNASRDDSAAGVIAIPKQPQASSITSGESGGLDRLLDRRLAPRLAARAHTEPGASDSSESSGSRSTNSGPGSTNSGPGSTNSGPASMNSGPGSTDSRSESTNSGPGSTNSGSDSYSSGAGSSGSGSASTTSGSSSTSSGPGSTSSGSGSDSSGSGSGTSGSGSESSGSEDSDSASSRSGESDSTSDDD